MSDPSDDDSFKLPDYNWLIENRQAVQTLLLELYKYLNEHPCLPRKEPDRLIYGHLVAIAFSLWRAIVFAHHPRDWKTVFEHIEAALKKLIEDNSFLFPDERASASWTVTYYLQNARLRLFYAIDRHASDIKSHERYSELSNAIVIAHPSASV
jgi:hypothetical protein